MPRFGKDKDARKEELDRQAAEEVERLTRRGGPPGMGGGMPGMPGMGGASDIMSSPLDRIAAELADAPRPSQRRAQAPRRAEPKPQQAFTPMPSGEVGSSFGPGGLNPGPRGMGGGAAPPPAFGGGGQDFGGGHVTGPPVYNAGEPDEEEEMSITELALMDHAAHTGHSPEDLVMQYDASTAEEMRDEAMRKFYERQQARRPGARTNSPFAPAGMRGPSGTAPVRRSEDPAAAGGALAQRLANRRRREEEEARRARAEAEPAAPAAPAGPESSAPTTRAREAEVDAGALARVLARRRQALSLDEPEPEPVPQPEPEAAAVAGPGPRHATSRAVTSPSLRAVPTPPDVDEVPSLDDMVASTPVRRSARSTKKAAAPAAKAPKAKAPAKATAAKATAAKATAKAPATARAATVAKPAKATKEPATVAPAAKAPATKGRTGGASLAKPAKAPTPKEPATKTPATKARSAGKAKTVFCIECGEKNPAIAKFCFNCGTRLAAPES